MQEIEGKSSPSVKLPKGTPPEELLSKFRQELKKQVYLKLVSQS